MPYLHIRVVDDKFDIVDEGCDYFELDDAHRAAIKAAGEIALDEVVRGQPSWIVEACVQEASGHPVDRITIAISTSKL